MKKAILSLSLALAMCLSLCVPAFAVENASSDMYTAKSLGTTTRHYWSFETGKSHDETSGSWKLIYNGEPATRTYGFELGACGTYNKVDRWEEVPAPTLEAKRAILPKIKLEYFEDSKARSLNPTSTLLYTEYYECVAGQYQLVSRQFA